MSTCRTYTYQLTDHLGNVRALITDRKRFVQLAPGRGIVDIDGNGTVDGEYRANLSGYYNYYAFGMEQPGRCLNAENYRYGFNGMEKDNFKGSGNSYTTQFRQYDPRLGRWLTKDPIVKPWESPFCAFANNPVYYTDPSGLDPYSRANRKAKRLSKKEGVSNVQITGEKKTGYNVTWSTPTAKCAEKFRINFFDKIGDKLKNFEMHLEGGNNREKRGKDLFSIRFSRKDPYPDIPESVFERGGNAKPGDPFQTIPGSQKSPNETKPNAVALVGSGNLVFGGGKSESLGNLVMRDGKDKGSIHDIHMESTLGGVDVSGSLVVHNYTFIPTGGLTLDDFSINDINGSSKDLNLSLGNISIGIGIARGANGGLVIDHSYSIQLSAPIVDIPISATFGKTDTHVRK